MTDKQLIEKVYNGTGMTRNVIIPPTIAGDKITAVFVEEYDREKDQKHYSEDIAHCLDSISKKYSNCLAVFKLLNGEDKIISLSKTLKELGLETGRTYTLTLKEKINTKCNSACYGECVNHIYELHP